MGQLIDFPFSVILFLRHFSSTDLHRDSSGLTQPPQQPSRAGTAQCAASWGKVQWTSGQSFTYGQSYLHFKVLESALATLIRGKNVYQCVDRIGLLGAATTPQNSFLSWI